MSKNKKIILAAIAFVAVVAVFLTVPQWKNKLTATLGGRHKKQGKEADHA